MNTRKDGPKTRSDLTRQRVRNMLLYKVYATDDEMKAGGAAVTILVLVILAVAGVVRLIGWL